MRKYLYPPTDVLAARNSAKKLRYFRHDTRLSSRLGNGTRIDFFNNFPFFEILDLGEDICRPETEVNTRSDPRSSHCFNSITWKPTFLLHSSRYDSFINTPNTILYMKFLPIYKWDLISPRRIQSTPLTHVLWRTCNPQIIFLSLVAVFFAKISPYPPNADRLRKKGVQKGKGQSVNTEPLFP